MRFAADHMSTQKLCPECEAANQPYAAICANCGYEFSVPPSPPPDTVPSTAPPRAPEYHSPHPLSPPPQRQLTRRYLFYGVIGLLALLIVAGALAAGISPSPFTTTAPAAVPPMQAPIAASTPMPSASLITPAKTPAVSANQESAARAALMASAPFLSPTLTSGPNSGAQTYHAPSVVNGASAYSFQGHSEAQKTEPQNANIAASATTGVTTREGVVKTSASPNTAGISPTGASSTGIPSQSVTVSAPTAQEAGWNTVTVKYPPDSAWKTDTAVNPNGNEGLSITTNETAAGGPYQHVTYGGSNAYGDAVNNVVNVAGPLNIATDVTTTTSVGGTPHVTVDVTTAAGVDATMLPYYTPPSVA